MRVACLLHSCQCRVVIKCCSNNELSPMTKDLAAWKKGWTNDIVAPLTQNTKLWYTWMIQFVLYKIGQYTYSTVKMKFKYQNYIND